MNVIPAEGEVVTLMKVDKKDGTRYYLQIGESFVEITEEEYKQRGGE